MITATSGNRTLSIFTLPYDRLWAARLILLSFLARYLRPLRGSLRGKIWSAFASAFRMRLTYMSELDQKDLSYLKGRKVCCRLYI